MADGDGLSGLLAYVNEQRGIDFALYRHATVRRKLDLRLQATKSASYDAYLEYLKSHPAEFGNLIEALTIKVTDFFRDPAVFELLASRVIPDVISRFSPVRIWSLGCAGGEEPYSLALIVSDLMKRGNKAVHVEIVGTDIDSAAIVKASRGEYPESEIAKAGKEYAEEFSAMAGSHAAGNRMYRLSSRIKGMVRFENDDIVSGLKRARDAGRTYHIVLCRNVLIYMSRPLQEEVVGGISDILCAGGYVVTGESESLPDSSRDRFTRTFPELKIYCRNSDSR